MGGGWEGESGEGGMEELFPLQHKTRLTCTSTSDLSIGGTDESIHLTYFFALAPSLSVTDCSCLRERRSSPRQLSPTPLLCACAVVVVTVCSVMSSSRSSPRRKRDYSSSPSPVRRRGRHRSRSNSREKLRSRRHSSSESDSHRV